jgi:DNA-binding CsgD family transcriptional regulator
MTYLNIIIHIFSITVGLFTIFLAYRMYQTVHLKCLSTYLYYLITYAVFGLIINVGIKLVPIFFQGQSPLSYQVAINLLCLLAFPLYPVAVYFFISFTRGLMGNTLSPGFRIGFISSWVLFSIFFLLAISQFLDTGDEALFYSAIFIGSVMGNVLLYWATIHLLIKTKDLEEKIKQKGMRIFGFLYLGCFLIEYLNDYLTNQRIDFVSIPLPVLFFSLNLPPVIYLNIFLKKYYRQTVLEPEKQGDLTQLFFNHNITNREQEIIQLILKGKSNKEIEDELFVSMQTVKNSVSIIYKKLGVKNRIQLSNLIRNAQRNDSF